MERDSFVFYRSFYDAVKDLPNDIKLEVLTAIIEYALFDKDPDNLKPIAKGMFVLVKPNLDVNKKRYENGTKGGRRSKSAGAPVKKVATPPPVMSDAFADEVSQLKNDTSWCEATCMQYHIDTSTLHSRLDAFVVHCKVERPDNPHATLAEARRHFCAWMRKVYPVKIDSPTPSTTDYSFKGGFGGQDT